MQHRPITPPPPQYRIAILVWAAALPLPLLAAADTATNPRMASNPLTVFPVLVILGIVGAVKARAGRTWGRPTAAAAALILGLVVSVVLSEPQLWTAGGAEQSLMLAELLLVAMAYLLLLNPRVSAHLAGVAPGPHPSPTDEQQRQQQEVAERTSRRAHLLLVAAALGNGAAYLLQLVIRTTAGGFDVSRTWTALILAALGYAVVLDTTALAGPLLLAALVQLIGFGGAVVLILRTRRTGYFR